MRDNQNRALCVIPARGGSKRIPRKNVKDFLGKPLIAYSIEAALNSGVFECVIVSTDDTEIANVAVKFGAQVPFMRDASLSDDYATSSDAVADAAARLGGYSHVAAYMRPRRLSREKFYARHTVNLKKRSASFYFQRPSLASLSSARLGLARTAP